MTALSDARAKWIIRELARLPDTGDLRERITIERVTSTPDGAGGYTRLWGPLGAKRWAQLLPTAGREAVLNEALQGIQAYKVTLRFDPTITAEDRIDWNGTKLNIRSAGDPLGTKVFTVIFADAGVGTE